MDGVRYTERFERGHVARPFRSEGKSDPGNSHGVKVTFKPDPTIFEDTVFDFKMLLNRMREQAFLNGGVRICLRDERPRTDSEGNPLPPPEEDLCYEGGIRHFVEYLAEHQKHATPCHNQVIYMRGEKGTSVAEIALQYTDSYDECVMTFANNMNTIEGGTHETRLPVRSYPRHQRLRAPGGHPEGQRQESVRRGRPGRGFAPRCVGPSGERAV